MAKQKKAEVVPTKEPAVVSQETPGTAHLSDAQNDLLMRGKQASGEIKLILEKYHLALSVDLSKLNVKDLTPILIDAQPLENNG